MNRIESLKEVKAKLEELSEYLQETDKDHPMQKADPYWDTKCFHALVNTADEAIEWVARELGDEEENEMFRENEALPDDGIRTGALVGQ